MKRQQYLRHRLQTLGALRDAVGAMRSLAAHHFRRARQGLYAARDYRAEIETIIGQIGLRQRLHAGLPAAMLVIASDLGLCGDYNTRVVQLAAADCQGLGIGKLYSVTGST